jgi:hypothetical protein
MVVPSLLYLRLLLLVGNLHSTLGCIILLIPLWVVTWRVRLAMSVLTLKFLANVSGVIVGIGLPTSKLEIVVVVMSVDGVCNCRLDTLTDASNHFRKAA